MLSCNNVEPKKNIMDTLKGEWSWIKTYDGFLKNATDNEFKSIIKILSQNEDASISYEVFVEDTLFYRGSFQVLYDWVVDGYYGRAIMTLPHSTQHFEWFICLGDPRGIITDKDILCFDNCPVDCFVDGDKYYYKKIK